MELAYKFRLLPNSKQEEQIVNNFGCCRFVYNCLLSYRKEVYAAEKRTAGYNECAKMLPILKDKYEWLAVADSTALQSSVRNLDNAFQNFFRGLKKPAKKGHKKRKVGYPQYKSKHDTHQSYTCKTVGSNIRVIDDEHIQLPKIGAVRFIKSREIKGRILSATVSRSASGKYYVSLCCADVEVAALPKTGAVTGVDLGIADLAVLDNGFKYANNKYLSKSAKKLAKLQRSLSRKSKGSNNRKKAKLKVAVLQERIANRRKDAIHKATTELIRNYDIICIEDLDVQEMKKSNHYSAKGFSDSAPYEFRRQLEYKAMMYGKTVVNIGRYFPSSQLCHDCGFQNPAVKDTRIRKWVCPECGTFHDRDINAAKNILTEGLKILSV